MNTLGDTDEGRARPSVWPVYVVAVVVLVTSVGLVLLGSGVLLAAEDIVGQFRAQPEFSSIFLAAAAWGLFGVVTAIGMFRLQGWGWWCGSLFVGVQMVGGALPLLGRMLPGPAPLTSTIVSEAAFLVVAVLLLGVLATRRQLFFPPKPEGEK